VKQDPRRHVKRILLFLVILLAVTWIAKLLFTPSGFGKYGHYRAGAIDEEVVKKPVNLTNFSCVKCHEYDNELLMAGLHRTLSCEFCHGSGEKHIQNGKVVEKLAVQSGDELNALCMRCHNIAQRAVMTNVKIVKTVVMPDHLKKQNVNLEHSCNQCHLVHKPMDYINKAKKAVGIEERVEEAGLWTMLKK